MTNDEKESIEKAINSMKIIGTFCEKCRQPSCICRVNDAKLKAIDDNYKWIVLDGIIYRILKNEYAELQACVNSCCGTCNEDTLMELRKVCIRIKNNYKPYTKWYHNFSTPTTKEEDERNELKL